MGAGPAGTVTAMLLAKRGYTLDVYERRGRPSRALAATLHSYILALTPRYPPVQQPWMFFCRMVSPRNMEGETAKRPTLLRKHRLTGLF